MALTCAWLPVPAAPEPVTAASACLPAPPSAPAPSPGASPVLLLLDLLLKLMVRRPRLAAAVLLLLGSTRCSSTQNRSHSWLFSSVGRTCSDIGAHNGTQASRLLSLTRSRPGPTQLKCAPGTLKHACVSICTGPAAAATPNGGSDASRG